MYIDSHCHLNLIQQDQLSGVDLLIQEAKKNHVRHMLCVSTGMSSWQSMADLLLPFENVSLSAGNHPGNVENEAQSTEESFAHALSDERVIAIGETGLDYHYTTEHKVLQQSHFIEQIDIAKSHQKPLIIHTRDARQDTIDILKNERADEAGFILHCFTENWEMAKKGLDLGGYISFSGIITFNNAQELRDVAKKIPLDRLLIETDSPYLAPVPHRGKTNQPSFVPHVAAMLATIKEESVESIAQITADNFNRLFNTYF